MALCPAGERFHLGFAGLASWLPIDDELPQVVAALQEGNALVLRAPPGAGKTTRVPPALLRANIAPQGKIVVLQPRRIAARATAARIAAENGWQLGDVIGYQIRRDSRSGPQTRVEIITEGILLRRLLHDPFLTDIAAVVFDEFHERSIASDLALAMVRQVQQSVRPELRILVMSATLAAEPIAAYLGGCPIVESAGRTFPVEIEYLPTLDRRPLATNVAEGVQRELNRTAGDCLVFLPGLGEIRQCERELVRFAEEQNLALVSLYGDLPADQQDAALQPQSRRKVILATNVAETSLTIDGVTSVVDSGLARMLRYDDRTGLDCLEVVPISKAAAEQRAGRAGRTAPGSCLRLWPEASQRIRPDFELPEIRRADLAGPVLQLMCWIEPDLRAFPWYERPSPASVERAQLLLSWLGAVRDATITPLGRQMADLPVHPRLARLLLEGKRLGVARQASLAAALLSERGAFLRDERPSHSRTVVAHSRSDLLDRVHALEAFSDKGLRESDVGTINRSAAWQVLQARDQLLRLVADEPHNGTSRGGTEEDRFLQAALAAYPDRLARRREPGSRRGVMVGGRGVRLGPQVALADEELYVCIEVEGSGAEGIVRQASAVNRAWLPAAELESQTLVAFDEATERVAARRVVAWNGLVLEEAQAALPGGEEITEVLRAAAQTRLERAFPGADAAIASFRARVECLRQWMPELTLPALDHETLAGLLPQLVPGRRSLAELRSAPWLQAMKGLFTWQQLQTIDREAPERIEVPSGSRIALAYEQGRPPVLAVRIQEVFGLHETPRIAGGRVRVLVHLLAPNMRVAQVTDDLASFWANAYAQVRKDLRARYPKHSWPEDPHTALAQSRPRRN